MKQNEMKETQFVLAVTAALMIVCGWIWKFFPTASYPEYTWIKEQAGVATWLFGVVTMLAFGFYVYQLLSELFQVVIWETEKKLIRRFNRRLHWSFGAISGIAICLATAILCVEIAFATFDPEPILQLTGGLWTVIGVGALMVTGVAFGQALFAVHARIANSLNRKNPPFFV